MIKIIKYTIVCILLLIPLGLSIIGYGAIKYAEKSYEEQTEIINQSRERVNEIRKREIVNEKNPTTKN
jgi:hypothetical protein